jgi:hypothetical protein
MQGFAEPHHARPPATAVPATARVVGDPVADPTATTLKLYAGDWARFVAWCREQGCPALPASSETLATYLLAVAPALSRGSLGRRRAAISTMHRQAGWPTALLDPDSHKALRAAAKPKQAGLRSRPTTAGLVRMAGSRPRDLAGLRDRALLLLAAATLRAKRSRSAVEGQPDNETAHARSAGVPRLFLLALDAEHVRFTPSGVTLGVRVRTDEAVPSRIVTLTRQATAATCPVRALEDWLGRSDTAFGPVFRKVDRWGNVEHGRLAPDAWHRILDAAAGIRAGVSPKAVADGPLGGRQRGAGGRYSRCVPARSAACCPHTSGHERAACRISRRRRGNARECARTSRPGGRRRAGESPGGSTAAAAAHGLAATPLDGDRPGCRGGGFPKRGIWRGHHPLAAGPRQPAGGLVPPSGQPGQPHVEP